MVKKFLPQNLRLHIQFEFESGKKDLILLLFPSNWIHFLTSKFKMGQEKWVSWLKVFTSTIFSFQGQFSDEVGNKCYENVNTGTIWLC